MPAKRYLSIIPIVLFLTGAAAAVEHHENYDEAGLDLLVLDMYVKASLEAINGSLESCLELDAEQAGLWSREYTSMVRGAAAMLEQIPGEVDSYGYLSRYIEGLSRVEVNLSSTVVALTKATGASEILALEDEPSWEEASIRENLTKLDSALTDLDYGITSLSLSASMLMDDLLFLMEVGLDVSGQRGLAEKVAGLGRNISEGLLGPGEVLSLFMAHPMRSWAAELGHLLEDGEMEGELERCSAILAAVAPTLRGGLRGPVGIVSQHLSVASMSTTSFRGHQVIFLEMITVLEEGKGSSEGLAERVALFERCRAAISSMEGHLASMALARIGLSDHDGGAVSSGLQDLEGLLSSYRERLEGVELIEARFGTVTAMVNSTFWANVLDADTDGDGDLSAEEAMGLELGALASQLSGHLASEWAVLRSELMELPGWLISDLQGTVEDLDLLVAGAVGLTSSHYELLPGLVALTNGTRSGTALRTLTDCMGHISLMRAALSDVPDAVSGLSREGVPASGLFVDPLNMLLELYEGLLLDIGRTINGTILTLTLWPSELPYDSELRFSATLMVRDAMDGTMLPTGPTMSFELDGVPLVNMTVSSGRASGKLTIDRNMTIGDHGLRASWTNATGTELNDSASFSVRRLRTTLALTAPRTLVGPGETVPLTAEAKDEMLRPYDGNLTLGGLTYHINGTFRTNVGFDEVGGHLIVGTIPLTDHFEDASANLRFMVMVDPVLSLAAERSTIYEDEPLNLTLTVVLGEGEASLIIGDLERILGPLSNGSVATLSVLGAELGPGTHIVRASLVTGVPWARSGWSLPVMITVLEREEDEVRPPPPEENVTWEEEEGPSFWEDLIPDWDILKGPLLRVILLALVALALMLVLSFLVIRLRRERGRKDGVRLPRLHVRKRFLRQPGEDVPEPDTPTDRGPSGTVPERRALEAALREDPDRQELIRMWLEVIDGSSELGIRRSMTPREAASRLSDLGFDPDASGRLCSNFERSIYQKGAPDRSDLSEFGSDKGRVSRFVEAFRERLRPLLGQGGGSR